MLSNCTDSVISRWGGEEFLILIKKPLAGYSMMENLRTNVSREKFEFESNDIKVSITIGLAGYDKARSIDKWIQEADDRLYEGKSNGKNKVVG